MNSTGRSLCLLLTSFLLFSDTTAFAGLVVSVGNAVIAPGGTGYVDVTIAGNAPLGDALAMFGFEFRIETAGVTRLDFVNPQSDWQLTSSDYVLAGDSAAAMFPPVGLVTTVVVPNDTYIGGDGTGSSDDVLVTSTSRLLARLELTAQTDLSPGVGDTFTITLVNSANTFFLDSAFADVAYQSTIGTVQIVPEPATWTLAMLAWVMFGVRWRRFA